MIRIVNLHSGNREIGREGLGEGDGRRGGEMDRINTKHRGNRERGFRGGVKRCEEVVI